MAVSLDSRDRDVIAMTATGFGSEIIKVRITEIAKFLVRSSFLSKNHHK